MQGVSALKALLPALLLAACATTPISSLDAFAGRSGHNSFEVVGRSVPVSETLVLPLEHDRQTRGPSCGAHALASIVNYWRGSNAISGEAIFAAHPPAAPNGYSMAELIALAQGQGVLASGVRLSQSEIVAELERGRPVLAPVRLPAIYIQPRTLPASNVPIIGLPSNVIAHRAARFAEFSDRGMIDHYLVIAGYGGDRFVVLEPILGYRTISFEKLARYRRAYGDAAIVFSRIPDSS